jgi:hypothetical protein
VGIGLTAISSICFVVGVWIARLSGPQAAEAGRHELYISHKFWWFCVVGGFMFTYGFSFLRDLPSIGAAIEKGGAVWMVGVLLGLRSAVERSDVKRACIWLAVLMVYPTLMLLFGGFLSYGSSAIIIVLSALVVSTRSQWRVWAVACCGIFVGLTIFVNYFGHRDEIRRAVWGGAALEDRVSVVADAFSTTFEWFDPTNIEHLISLDKRLNQNYFAGLAATRIQEGRVDYLYGRSIWEAALSLVPRILWPDKPVFAGSPAIVSEMTGLHLSTTTSFGVGNVMELQVNFGLPGLVIGFCAFGWLLGMLDRKAALAEASGNLPSLLLFFLVSVALIQPNGSLVEMLSGAAAAFLAAHGWAWTWKRWAGRGSAIHRTRTTNTNAPL